MTAFCLYPKNLPKGKFKSSLLFTFAKISKLPYTGSVILLLIITPLKGYNEKEQVVQNKYKIYSLEKKTTLKFLILQPISVLDERLKLLRIVPLRRGQICTWIKGSVPSGQDYTQLTSQLGREGRRQLQWKAGANVDHMVQVPNQAWSQIW